KHFGKNSISSALKIVIDIALAVELLTIAIMLWQTFVFLPSHNNQDKFLFFAFLSKSVFGIISFLITLQLRKLISSFKREAFFELINVKRIQSISLLLFLYVVCDVILSLTNPNLHLFEGISKTIGNIPFVTAFLSIVYTVNFKILFLAAVIFVISRVFKNGYELKEQATLTI
ncbi:MAG: DUF2975 domain-containing protein, partial [Bacteroidales bacterium]|nr:DUF2975 domain-containing protein [Bacteroidales bacterium]